MSRRGQSWLPLGALLIASACAGNGKDAAPAPAPAARHAPATARNPIATAAIEENEGNPADLARGAALADRFQGELMRALTGAMAQGGPTHAVTVCSEQAPAIAARLSSESGATVRRVSLRPRNPLAAPDDMERAILDRFAKAPLDSAGRPVQWSGHVRTATGPATRYMRAIPTGPLCLACHGPAVAPDVAAAIHARYPADQATGFTVGQLRGAFSIRWRD